MVLVFKWNKHAILTHTALENMNILKALFFWLDNTQFYITCDSLIRQQPPQIDINY